MDAKLNFLGEVEFFDWFFCVFTSITGFFYGLCLAEAVRQGDLLLAALMMLVPLTAFLLWLLVYYVKIEWWEW